MYISICRYDSKFENYVKFVLFNNLFELLNDENQLSLLQLILAIKNFFHVQINYIQKIMIEVIFIFLLCGNNKN